MANLPDLYKLFKLPEKVNLYNSFSVPIWSPALRRWVSTNPTVIKDILNSPAFRVVNHEIGKVEDRFQVNLKHLAKFVTYLPVTRDGAQHKELRKNFALTIQKNSAKSLEFFKTTIDNEFKKVFYSEGEIDLCSDLLMPVIQKTSQILAGIEKLDSNDLEKISTVFDETLNISNRIELNNNLDQMIRKLNDDLDLEECYFRVALFALGNDSVLSTMSESIIHVLMKHPKQLISSIDWDKQIPVTGVPVIERVCVSDVDIAGVSIKNNQRVRLYLDAAGYEGEGCPHYSPLYFGSGPHLCLGMPIASKMWTMIASAFLKVNKKIDVVEIKARKNDNVFNVYETIRIKFYD